MLEVQRDAALVGVECEEVAAVHAGFLGAAIAARLPLAGLLHLDDVGAEPGQELRAGGAGLELGQVQDADAVQGFAHNGRIIGYDASAGNSASRRPKPGRRSALLKARSIAQNDA